MSPVSSIAANYSSENIAGNSIVTVSGPNSALASTNCEFGSSPTAEPCEPDRPLIEENCDRSDSVE